MAPLPPISVLVVGPAEDLASILPGQAPSDLHRADNPPDAIVRLARKPFHLVLIDQTAEEDLTEEQLGYLRALHAIRPSARTVALVSHTTPRKVIEARRMEVEAKRLETEESIRLRTEDMNRAVQEREFTVSKEKQRLEQEAVQEGEEARVRRERTVSLAVMDKETKLAEIAVEVERISEGQRFTTKLLAERTAPSPGPGGTPPGS
jgi:hypothetical protein